MSFVESDSKLVTIASMLWRWGPLKFFQLRSQGSALISAFDELYKAPQSIACYLAAAWQRALMRDTFVMHGVGPESRPKLQNTHGAPESGVVG